MAKIDVRAALTQSGIRCEYEGNLGKVLLVTPDLLNNFRAGDDSTGPSVQGGDILVSYIVDGKAVGKKLFPEAENQLSLEIGEGTIGFNNPVDLIRAVRNLNEGQNGEELSARDARNVEQIKGYVDYLFTAGLEQRDSRTPEMRSVEFSYKMEKSRQNEKNGLTGEQLDKIATARSLREAIGRVNPDHADALNAEQVQRGGSENAYELFDNLRDAAGPSTMPKIDPRLMSQFYRVSQDLSRQVFAALTTTPITSLLSQPIGQQGYQNLRQEMDAGRVEGGFNAVIKERLENIFDARMPGYADKDNLRADLYTGGGADFLLVRDQAGYYVYGWNTDSRVLELPEEGLLVLGEADVPSDEEIERLREVLSDLRHDLGQEPEFLAFGEGFGGRQEAEELGQDIADAIADYENDRYDEDGYDEDGYDEDGYDEDGYDRDGYDRDGYDQEGFDKEGEPDHSKADFNGYY